MVYPQIHISRKLSHFLTTLGVKAVLRFLEVDFCCLRFFFAFWELLGCGSLQEEKASQNFITIGVLLFPELEERKPSRIFRALSKKEEIIDMVLC